MSHRWCWFPRWLPWVLGVGLWLVCRPGIADDHQVRQALQSIGSGDIQRVEAAVTALGSGSDERALRILWALERGTLEYDSVGQAVIKEEAGYADAVTLEPALPTGKLASPLVNNSVRRVLGPALARLRLGSRDVNVRVEAATELAKRPSDDLLETVQLALARETDRGVAKLLGLSIAQIELRSPDRERRSSALAILEEEGDVSHKGDIERILAKDEAGEYREPDADLRRAARGALQAIERRVIVISMLANCLYGLSLGSVLLLAALGLAITFGLMKVINMAHGEMLMIGAYATFVVQNTMTSWGPPWADYYLVAAVPAAFLVAGGVGFLLERGVIRYLYGRPLETLLATWGISLLLIQSVRLVFGAQNVTVSNPSWLSGGWELMPTVVLPYSRIAIVGFVVVLVGFVWALLRGTRLGLHVRAVTQNREMAGNLGIATSRVDVWTFVFGSGVAGLGGVALSQLGNVGPELGQGFIVDSFMVVVLGGVGNIAGTIVGAIGLGLANKFLEPVMGAVLGKIAILVLIILFIQKRPQGLFALKGRAADL